MSQTRNIQYRSDAPAHHGASNLHRTLIVDDDPANRALCRAVVLETQGIPCDEAADGAAALQILRTNHYDLVLLDVDMPKMNGTEVLRRLRADPPTPHLKIIMLSGRVSGDEMAQLMRAGADDYLSKPYSVVQLRERVKAALRLKDAQDRSDLLHRQLQVVNHEMEKTLAARDSDLTHARNALVLSLAEIVAWRDAETGEHLLRLQHYCRCLAEEAAHLSGFADQIDEHFISLLECCVPLHDIGKIGVPDEILLKPGKLSPDEHLIMQQHTVVAANMLRKVASRHYSAVGFMQMAIDIAHYHHERYDGGGYPDHLTGEAIPLAARIVAIADVYDALRSRRAYKPPHTHLTAMKIIAEEEDGHFDPALLAVFQQRCAPEFKWLFQELTD
jgi:putative two-component system response regulator